MWHHHFPLTKNMEDSKELERRGGELMEATWFIFFLSLFQFHPSLDTNWNQVLTLRTNLVLRSSYMSCLSFIFMPTLPFHPLFQYQYKHDNEHALDMTLLDTINSTFFFFSKLNYGLFLYTHLPSYELNTHLIQSFIYYVFHFFNKFIFQKKNSD